MEDQEDTSQRTGDQIKGTQTMERVGLEIMDCREGQADWRAGKVEKSKLDRMGSGGNSVHLDGIIKVIC